jgi:DNA-binding PadR family transcriptional regulator
MYRELLLLGLLRQGEMHGYRLNEFINHDLAYCTDLKRATAYHLLGKMTESGWIVETEEQAGNRPPRKVYQLTADGEQAFQRLLRENLAAHTPTRFPDDMGIAFLDALPLAEARELLLARRRGIQAEQAAVQAVLSAEHRYGGLGITLVLEHQARHLAAEIAWLDDVIARLFPDEQRKES